MARRSAAVYAACILLFMLGGALNYYRLPFTSYSGLEVQKSSTQDLANLCRALGRQADDLGQQVHRRGNGAMDINNKARIHWACRRGMRELDISIMQPRQASVTW